MVLSCRLNAWGLKRFESGEVSVMETLAEALKDQEYTASKRSPL